MATSLIINYGHNRDVRFIVKNNGSNIPNGRLIDIIDVDNACVNLPATAAIQEHSSFLVPNLGIKDVIGGPWPIKIRYSNTESNLVYIGTSYGLSDLPFVLTVDRQVIDLNTEVSLKFTIKYDGQPIQQGAYVTLDAPLGNWVDLPEVDQQPVGFLIDATGSFVVADIKVQTLVSNDAPLRVKIGTPGSTNFKLTNNVYFVIIDTSAPPTDDPLEITTPDVLPDAYVDYLYTYKFEAIGGRPPYKWTLDGIDLSQFFFRQNTSMSKLVGIPTVPITHNWTLTITDLVGTTTIKPITLTVKHKLKIVGRFDTSYTESGSNLSFLRELTHLSFGYVGISYDSVKNYPKVVSQFGTYTWTITGLPNGLTYNNSTGSISGIPTQKGIFDVTISARDSLNQVASITVPLAIYDLSSVTEKDLDLGISIGKDQYTTHDNAINAGMTPLDNILIAGTYEISSDNKLASTQGGAKTVREVFYPYNKIWQMPSGFVGSTHTLINHFGSRQLLQGIRFIARNNLSGIKTVRLYVLTHLDYYAAARLVHTYKNVTPSDANDSDLNYIYSCMLDTPTQCYGWLLELTSIDNTNANNLPMLSNVTTYGWYLEDTNIHIEPRELNHGYTNVLYNDVLSIRHGTPPYVWNIAGLPTGLSYSSVTGIIIGTPSVAGNYLLYIQVTDKASKSTATFKQLYIRANTSNRGMIASPIAGTITGTTMTKTLNYAAPDYAHIVPEYNIFYPVQTGFNGITYPDATQDPYLVFYPNTETWAIPNSSAVNNPRANAYAVFDELKWVKTIRFYTTHNEQGAFQTQVFALQDPTDLYGQLINIYKNPLDTITPTFNNIYIHTLYLDQAVQCRGIRLCMIAQKNDAYVIVNSIVIYLTQPETLVIPNYVTITSKYLPKGIINQGYTTTLTVSGGVAPYTWSLNKVLPTGLTLNASTGVILGTLTVPNIGFYDINVKVQDSQGYADNKLLKLGVGTTLLTPNGFVSDINTSTFKDEYGEDLRSPTIDVYPSPNDIIEEGTHILLPSTNAWLGRPLSAATQEQAFYPDRKIWKFTASTGTFIIQLGSIKLIEAIRFITHNSDDGISKIEIYTLNSTTDVNGTLYQTIQHQGPYKANTIPNLQVSFTVNAILTTPIYAYGVRCVVTPLGSTSTVWLMDIALYGEDSAYDELAITTVDLSTGTKNVAYTFGLTATGGKQPYTWNIVGLPTGVTYNPATGMISGTPISVGSTPLTITLTDDLGLTRTAVITFTVVDTLTITTTSLADGLNNMYYHQTLYASGGIQPYTWSSTTLPIGLSLASNTGIISGYPSATTSSLTSIVLTLTDAQNTVVTKTLNIQVYSNVEILTTTVPNITIGVYYATKLYATEGLLPYTWSTESNLPTGLTLDTSTGDISGVATTDYNADIVFIVTDAKDQTDTQSIRFLATHSLTITTLNLPEGSNGYAYSQTITGSGGQQPYSWSVTGLPTGLSINSSTGVISGTPVVSSTNTFDIRVTITDKLSNTHYRDYTLTIYENIVIDTIALSTGIVSIPYQSLVEAHGGKGPLVYSITSTSWSSLIIDSVTGELTASAPSGTSSGMPTTIRVTDSLNHYVEQTYSIVVTNKQPLKITVPDTVNAAIQGTQGINVLLTATGGVYSHHWEMYGTPGGLYINHLSNLVNRIMGNPESYGTFQVLLIVRDADDPVQYDSKLITLILQPGVSSTDYVLIDTLSLPVPESPIAPYTATVTGTSTSSSPNFIWSFINDASSYVPSNLSIHPTTGVLTGSNFIPGIYDFSIRLDDTSINQHAIQSYHFVIPGFASNVYIVDETIPDAYRNTNYETNILARSSTPSADTFTWSILNQSNMSWMNIASIFSAPQTAFSIAQLYGLVGSVVGIHSLIVRVVTNQGDNYIRTFKLVVLPNDYTETQPDVLPLEITTTSLPQVTDLNNYTTTLTATGGVTPYKWSLITGGTDILLPSVHIDEDTGILTGQFTNVNTLPVVITVQDPDKRIAHKLFNITHIFEELMITTTLLPYVIINEPYSTTITASGGIPPYSWYNSSMPLISNTHLPDGTFNSQYIATIEVTNGAPPYTLTAIGLPAGLSISGLTISGTLIEAGIFNITIKITDAYQVAVQRDFTIIIQ
jgi:hypothetical protein